MNTLKLIAQVFFWVFVVLFLVFVGIILLFQWIVGMI